MSGAAQPQPASGKKHFVVRLIPPRSTFFTDMNDEERAIMVAHGAYWRDLMARGHAILFGPVLDPKGVWGLGVVEAANPDEVHALCADDPSIKSGLNTPEILEFRAVVR